MQEIFCRYHHSTTNCTEGSVMGIVGLVVEVHLTVLLEIEEMVPTHVSRSATLKNLPSPRVLHIYAFPNRKPHVRLCNICAVDSSGAIYFQKMVHHFCNAICGISTFWLQWQFFPANWHFPVQDHKFLHTTG